MRGCPFTDQESLQSLSVPRAEPKLIQNFTNSEMVIADLTVQLMSMSKSQLEGTPRFRTPVARKLLHALELPWRCGVLETSS